MIKKVEEAKIVLTCEDDPVLFAEIACMCNNMELYDWQKELLEAFHKNLKVDCDTRNHLVSIRPKCGITTVYALYALWNSIFKYGFNTLYYSHTFRSGKEFLKIIDTFKDNLPPYLKEEYKEKRGYDRIFESGNRILIATGVNDCRGYSMNLTILDNCSMMTDANLEDFMQCMFPVLGSRGSKHLGQLIMSNNLDVPKPFTVIYERANEGLNSFKRPHIIDA